jgi:hypothetical protein
MEMIVVGKRSVRLLHDFRSSYARAQGRSATFSVGEQPRAQWRGNENVGYVCGLVADHGRDECPVLCVIEICTGPADRRPIGAELDEAAGEKLTAVDSVNEEANVGVATALVGAVALDSAATLARKVADRGNAIGKLATNGACRAIHHRDKWFQAPAHIALRVRRYDA